MWHDACRRWRIGVPEHALTVGALTAARGEKRFGVNEFTIDGRPYRLSTWLINGDHDGPTLVVTAGVHAAEYASIAAALEFGRRRCPSLPRA
jgi:predicted deacylase